MTGQTLVLFTAEAGINAICRPLHYAVIMHPKLLQQLAALAWISGFVESGTLIPSAQRLVWAAKQPLGNAALGALFA